MKILLILTLSFIPLKAFSKQPLMIFFQDMKCENTNFNTSWYIRSKLSENSYEMLTSSQETVVVNLSSISFKSQGSISPYEIFLKQTGIKEYKMNNGFTQRIKIYEESFECLEYYLKNVSTQVIMSHTIPKITKKLKDEVNRAVDERKKAERKKINAEKIEKEKKVILTKYTQKGYDAIKEAKCFYVGEDAPWWRNIAGSQSDNDYGDYVQTDILDIYLIHKSEFDFVRDEGKTSTKYSSEPTPLYVGSQCTKIAKKHLKIQFKKKKANIKKRKSLYE